MFLPAEPACLGAPARFAARFALQEWGWLHQPTGITVWGDALDLTVRAGRMSQGGSHVNKHQAGRSLGKTMRGGMQLGVD